MKSILAVAAVVALAALAMWHPAPHPGIETTAATVPPRSAHRGRQKNPSAIVVYVAGAVPHPGLYRLSPLARTDDAIRMAGGMLADADPIAVNLAQRLQDGDEVAVTRVGERRPSARTARTRPRRSGKAAPPLEPIDVNSADSGTLATIPGLGKALADRIVTYRQLSGPFGSLDDLLDVQGITPARLDRISTFLSLQ